MADEQTRGPEQPTRDQSENKGVWLETVGEKFPIIGDCSLGRSPKNSIVIDSNKVSRRHAIINVQNIGEFWLIDLGSSNGTFLNHRRLQQPARLSDHDQVVIGDKIFIFHQPESISDDYRTTYAERTIREIANLPCWLLVADIEDFTQLSRSLTSDQLAVMFGSWVATCKEIVETHEGTIDKYLGDGFLAYWRDGPSASKMIGGAVGELKEAQARNEPRFRLALWLRRGRRNALNGRRKLDGQGSELCLSNGKACWLFKRIAAGQRICQVKTRQAHQSRTGWRPRTQRLRKQVRVL